MSVENLIKSNRHLVDVVVSDFAKSRPHLREEIESGLMLELWESVRDYDQTRGAKLSTYVLGRLKRKALNLVNPKKSAVASYYNRLVAPTTNENGERYTVEEFIDIVYSECERIPNTTEADQRQLIDSLCDPSQVDDVTTAIVTNFPRYKNLNALAKGLGLHREVVDRRLRKLARNYDAELFGDYRDYLYAG
ncbi:hypothetical protein M3626_20850 [Psychrobacillus sp. MER TA 17]|nr:hypothetical protein [Psychrobacillus sp. MER TA 17]